MTELNTFGPVTSSSLCDDHRTHAGAHPMAGTMSGPMSSAVVSLSTVLAHRHDAPMCRSAAT